MSEPKEIHPSMRKRNNRNNSLHPHCFEPNSENCSFPFQMSVDNRLVQQYWVSDSHMAVNHHLPAQYELVMKDIPDESQRYWLSPNMDLVKGGRRLFGDWVKWFCEEIQKPSFPRNYVLCCGTNNIRDAGIMGLKVVKQQLLDWHQAIIDAILGTKRATLLIVSPIPDDREWTHWIGEELDRELREMCLAAGPKVRYAPFRTQKTIFSGRHYRWRRELYHDDVHLNVEGARQLARCILEQQNNFPSAVYGISNCSPSAARIAEARRYRGEQLEEFDLRLTRFLHSIRWPQTGGQDPRGRLPSSQN